MPKLNDHGLGGSGKSLGVPIYPFETVEGVVEDTTKPLDRFYGNPITEAPIEIYSGASCRKGDDIYFFGSKSTNTSVYKYNVKAKSWTKLANSPNTDAKNWAETIGNSIWYAGTTTIYKYDISTNKHSEISSPRNFTGTKSTNDGEHIYLFGGQDTTTNSLAQKYDVNTNKLTNLTTIPEVMKYHGCEYGGDGYIYLFGGSGSLNAGIRYSIVDNSYETLSERIPFYYMDGITVRHENHIVLISSSFSNGSTNIEYNKMCVFDTSTLTFTQLTDVITSRHYGHGHIIDGTIYVIGGGQFSTSYNTGDCLTISQGESATFSVQRLYKGVKLHTDGGVKLGTLNDIGEIPIFENTTSIDKINGVARIATDGEYAIINGNYATIGG